MKTVIKIVNWLLVVTVVFASIATAGDTGKITGKVKDEKGEPVIGASVLVVGTQRGAATDFDGKYAIIGVPAGTYTLRASYLDSKLEIKNVKVSADQTTTLDFELASSAVVQKEVVITADKLVNKEATSSVKQVDTKEIEQIPAVKDISDVLKLQPGVVKQGNNVFLRGGRANEVQYVIDGIPVNAIVGNSGELATTSKGNTELAQLYAGVSSGAVGSGMAISANAIQTVQVKTSGFDADYGNAQSGIVNITTKSGTDKITAGMQFRTDKIANTNQNEVYQSYNLGGPEPISKYLLPSLGIKVPGSLSFFFNADITRSDGPYTYNENAFYNPLGRRIELQGFLGGIMNGLGFKFYDQQRNSFTFNSKIKYNISGEDQLMYGYRASLSTNHGYYHNWQYRADSSTLGATLSTQHILSWQHFFAGGESFMKVYFAKLAHRDGNDLAGMKPYDYPNVIDRSSNATDFDITRDGFNDLGSTQRWYQSNTTTWTMRFDYEGKIHEFHTLKTGFEFNYDELQSTEISNPTAVLVDDSLGIEVSPPYPDYMDRNRGLYPGYGEYRFVMDSYPNRGALYLQDNIEYQGLNIRVGLRYDYYDLGRQVYYDDFVSRWLSSVNPSSVETPYDPLQAEWYLAQGINDDGTVNSGKFLSDGARWWHFFSNGYFSPRLAIGYPITEDIVFYFNYGHFYQYPERNQFYRDLPKNIESWVGNPDLRPQKTVAYEAGFEDQVSPEMAFSIHAFYKDIFDYVTLVTRLGDIKIYKNLDYASTRGFEVSLSQAIGSNFSANASYSYQLAKGRSSSDVATVLNPDFNLPRETRLDWDQEHTANFFVAYRVGTREEGQFLGLPFVNNYGISVTYSYGSGFPYTPFYSGSSTLLRNAYLNNNETRPYTSTVNLSIYKGLLLFDKINVTLTLDVTNLLNRSNVNTGASGSGFNTAEGRPYEFGDYSPETKQLYSWRGMAYRVPPSVFDAPRQILFGVKLNWD